jgi:hypothetical protein
MHRGAPPNAHTTNLTVAVPISLFAGNIALFSMNVVPSLLRSRTEADLPLTTLVTQWREIYETGKRQNPPIAGLTAASFVYLAVLSSRKSSSSPPLLLFRRGPPYSRAGLYASAALLTLSIVPFTLIAMSSTNNALIDVCESQKQRGTGAGAAVVATGARVEELLQDWVALNRVRSLLPLLASLTGIAVALL